MADTGSEILVRAELPGFNKDEVKVHVTPTTVEISAEKKREKVVQTEKLYKREESFGSTRRVVSLPAVVETESARAKFENGVLAIIIKKKGKRSPAERSVRYG
jgi:HSP20 family protein